MNRDGAKKRVLILLEEIGPLASIEIAEHAGWSASYARAAVAYCRRLRPKRIFIEKYIRSEEFGRYYPRAVYALGDVDDAKKPRPLGQSVYNYRHRQNKLKKIGSVFALGTPVDKRRLTTKKRPDVAEKQRNGD